MVNYEWLRNRLLLLQRLVGKNNCFFALKKKIHISAFSNTTINQLKEV